VPCSSPPTSSPASRQRYGHSPSTRCFGCRYLVGAAARPFREDLKRLPALLLDFVLAPARLAFRVVLNRDAEST
jgi:hypothetical protein